MLHARRHLFCNGIDRPKRKKVNDKLHTCCHFLYNGTDGPKQKKDDDEHATHCCPFVFAKCKFNFFL
jgi:hypothetical protein